MRRNNGTFKVPMDAFRERKKKVEAGELDEDELILSVSKDDKKPLDEDEDKEEEAEEIKWTPQLVDEELTKILAARGRKVKSLQGTGRE